MISSADDLAAILVSHKNLVKILLPIIFDKYKILDVLLASNFLKQVSILLLFALRVNPVSYISLCKAVKEVLVYFYVIMV